MHSPCWKMGNISLGCGGKRNLMSGSFQLRGFWAVWYTYYIGRECVLKLDIYGKGYASKIKLSGLMNQRGEKKGYINN